MKLILQWVSRVLCPGVKENPEGNIPLEGPRRRLEDNILTWILKK
jgi:hypothetical protein